MTRTLALALLIAISFAVGGDAALGLEDKPQR